MRSHYCILPTVLVIIGLCHLVSAKDPTVALDYGIFHGFVNETSGIIYYRGVRYADPPVGKLRWRAPVSPPTEYLGHVSATEFAPACIPASQTGVSNSTSEDCLFLNVYVPSDISTREHLPVLVWIHGGGFQGGNSHEAIPELLMQATPEPIILVSVEYRLGGQRVKSNGSLNIGLLDQRAAFRWIQKYIGSFRGDRSRVTIWGQSAGAGSTMYHLLGNRGNNEGLFQSSMGDSPSLNFMPLYSSPYVEGILDQFSTFAGCANQEDVLECLRAANTSTLASAGAQTIGARTATLYTFAPMLDEAFLHTRPVEGFTNGEFARVPVLFGANSADGAGWSNQVRDPSANTSMPNSTEETVYNFFRGQYASLSRESFEKAFELYPLADYEGSYSLQGQQMYGEARYICTANMITAGLGRRNSEAYNFIYDNPHLGSCHGCELTAMFTPNPNNADEADLALFVLMRRFWTSFVVSSNPKASGVAWKQVTTSTGGPRMLLNPNTSGSRNITAGLAERCAFWHSLSAEINT